MSPRADLRLADHVRRFVCSRTGAEAVPGRPAPSRPLGLCACCPAPGAPLLVEYDEARLRACRGPSGPPWPEAPGLGRWAPLLPVVGLPEGYADDVGRTPVVPVASLAAELDVEVSAKLEGGNPSGSFKDRGLSIGVALGRALGARGVCLPTQGNAGVAAALFAARLGLPCLAYLPDRLEGSLYHRAARHYGADVRFAGRNIAEAGAELRRAHGAAIAAGELLDVSTFFEPGRLEGKKTMGLEIVERFGRDALPDWIVYPTGGGTGLVGMAKAFAELGVDRVPRFAAVQSAGCPPVVRSFAAGLDHVERVVSEGTIADGLDVPGAIMGHGILRALRASQGTAVAVPDAAIRAAFADLGRVGVPASYEGAATAAALRALVAAGTVARGSRVLLLVTAGPAVHLA